LLRSAVDPWLPNSQLRTPNYQTTNSELPSFADSAKLEAFRELLAEAVDDGHRSSCFRSSLRCLALLGLELDAQPLEYCYLDGSMPAGARQAAVDKFQASPDIPVFLLSLKAGGTGLNSRAPTRLFISTRGGIPAAEAQATDRAHRIGQGRVVTSYKLIAGRNRRGKGPRPAAKSARSSRGYSRRATRCRRNFTLADMKSLLTASPTFRIATAATRRSGQAKQVGLLRW